MLSYRKMDITTVTHGIVAHGCNCRGVMGSGVALAIKKKWPKAYESYRNFIYSAHVQGVDDSFLLGKVDHITIKRPNDVDPDELIVINMFTQYNYGSPTPDADLDAIRQAMLEVLDIAVCQEPVLPVYTVKVGCLRGGLNWDTQVKPIFESLASEYSEVPIIVCDI